MKSVSSAFLILACTSFAGSFAQAGGGEIGSSDGDALKPLELSCQVQMTYESAVASYMNAHQSESLDTKFDIEAMPGRSDVLQVGKNSSQKLQVGPVTAKVFIHKLQHWKIGKSAPYTIELTVGGVTSATEATGNGQIRISTKDYLNRGIYGLIFCGEKKKLQSLTDSQD